LEDCHIDGSERAARCGVLPRPEDPARVDGPQLAIRVVVIPASDVPRRNPLYLLAGGPGQAASEAFGPLLKRFAQLGRERDIVLVDQRGTGASSPLDCEAPPDGPLAERLREDNDLPLLRSCLAGYTVDPRNFITAIAMEDLDAVRESLGHATIDLLGGSYGTRAALVYARAHPERVGRIVIDGVAPVDMAMPSSFARDADDALAAVFRDCAAQPGCAAAFPDAEARFHRWHDDLRARPRKIDVEDPRTYEHVDIELTADMVALVLRNVLYVPALTAMLPLSLQRAGYGDMDSLIAQALVLGDAMGDSMSTGMFLSIVCAEDVPFIDEAMLTERSADTTAGTKLVELFRESCSVWPRAELPAGYREPVQLDTPTLVLSGALDPVTPPRWGEHVLNGLSAGRHVIVPGAGHGTLTQGCVPELIQSFLDGADALEVGCVDAVQRPPFFLDFAGPPP
ncbi:MAG: alpha/beta fold hydrolase, partial [Deltaproteobacteria bacterium]|nr:alpha/beta fold hydrolase [Nannocystaceae bacterium]